MIDFKTYEEVKLKDVAEFGRAKKDKIYPAGTSWLQIAATRGQVGYLKTKSKVETKNVVIIPQAGINPKYFNAVLEKNIQEYIYIYRAGLNIQEKDVGNFPIQLHNYETQQAIAELVQFCELEEQKERMQLEALFKLKKNLQATMFI